MGFKKQFNLSLIFILLYLFGIINGAGGENTKLKDQNFIKFHKIDTAWKYSKGDNTVVAVLDWCFDTSPKALKKYINPTSVVPGQGIGTLEPWHGEWMADIVHRIAPNAKILPIRTRPNPIRKDGKVINKQAYEQYVAKAIRFAADNGAVAVTSSMGLLKTSKELDDAIDYAWQRGTIFIDVHPEYKSMSDQAIIFCTKGKCNHKIIHTGIVSVPKYQIDPDSNRDIYLWPYSMEPKYKDGWGYSNGPPIVAGVIALMKSRRPDLKPNEIKNVLMQTAHMNGSFRILNAEAALRFLEIK